MSSGPKPLDCHQAAEHLYELMDQELTPELEAAVRAHLDDCKHCFSVYEYERAFKRFLEARTRSRGAPEQLRRRIFEQLLLEQDSPPAE
jgi:anti-sigma factor (TIGR02949 family)